jgi:hypothetical protein
MPMAWLTLFIVEQSAIQEMDYQVASSQQGGRREPNMIVSLPLVFIGANTEPESA